MRITTTTTKKTHTPENTKERDRKKKKKEESAQFNVGDDYKLIDIITQPLTLIYKLISMAVQPSPPEAKIRDKFLWPISFGPGELHC